MMSGETPSNEKARLETLRQYTVLDTETEEVFDEITKLAKMICRTPIALVSFVDHNRQWFKSRIGIPFSGTARDISFCGQAILQDGPLVVRDTLDDDRFRTNPMVLKEPYIRFYAGAPLVSPEGFKVGTLCVMDHTHRTLEEEQIDGLVMLANQVVALLELRRQVGFLTRALDVYRSAGNVIRNRPKVMN
jgi:GAF domain-containing protein